MKKILLLTHFFPPSELPEAICTFKRYLDSGWEIDVVASWALFTTVRNQDNEVRQLVSGHPYKMLGTQFEKESRKGSPRLARFRKRPDRYRRENKYLEKFLATIDLSQYDALVSTSQFHSVHLVARRMKSQNPNLKWVAHLSDPWSRNPLMRMPKLYKALNSGLEKRTLAGADLVTVPSPGVGELLRCSPSKIWTIPHCYVPELFFEEPDRGNPRVKSLMLRHIGSLGQTRSLKWFAAGIEELFERGLASDLFLELYGGKPPSGELERLGKVAKVKVVERRVPYIESLSLARSADGLIVVGDSLNASPYIPSKIADCVGAGKPILIISSPGPLQDLAHKYSLPNLRADNIPQHPIICEQFLSQCRNKDCLPQDLKEHFSQVTTTDALLAAFASLEMPT